MNEYLKMESDYIVSGIEKVLANDTRFNGLSDERINAIIDKEKWVERLHGRFILNAIFTFLESKGCDCSERICKKYLCSESDDLVFISIPILDADLIPSICEECHVSYLNTQYVYQNNGVLRITSKKNLVDKGAVYTQSKIARSIVESTLCNLSEEIPVCDLRVLDFATGTGRFYTELVDYISERYGCDSEQVVLNNVFAFDLDSIALNITRLKAFSYLHDYTEKNIQIICNKIILRNGLLREDEAMPDSIAISHDDFNGLFYEGFDAIVSNPPYLVLKPSKKIAPEAWTKLQEQIDYFRTSGVYTYSIEGMLNLYQISIESMLMMLKPGGELGVICPSTLFADMSSSKLRKHLLKNNNLRSIRYYAEKDDLFINVIQATCIFHLQKGGQTTNIDINEGKRSFKVSNSLICELFPEKMEIPNISSIEWGILRKLKSFTKLKDIDEIRSKRGELDLSILRRFITTIKTPYRLVRGNMISAQGITFDNGEYVDPAFLLTKTSDYLKNDFGKVRLICQQISNAALARRLVFCYCEKNDILGNSCNYLSAEAETLAKIELLLNSPLLNWRFKITSSNNHINNYELDELPIVDLNSVSTDIIVESRAAMSDYVCGLYGLNKKETKFIRDYENI